MGMVGAARLEDNGETLSVPHLGYGDRGVPGTIPDRAVLIAEITVLDTGAYSRLPLHTDQK
jgi:hypothetical protein